MFYLLGFYREFDEYGEYIFGNWKLLSSGTQIEIGSGGGMTAMRAAGADSTMSVMSLSIPVTVMEIVALDSSNLD